MFRNFELEKAVIKASFVDRKIANLLHKPTELRELMPVVMDSGDAVTSDGQLKIYSNDYVYERAVLLTPEITHQCFKSMGQICENRLTQIIYGVESIQTVGSWWPALNLTLYPLFTNMLPTLTSAAERLAPTLGFNGVNWNSSYNPESGKWRQTLESHANTYKIFDYNGNVTEQFVIVIDGSFYSVLPVTLFQNLSVQQPFVSFIPSIGKRALLNENLLKLYPSSSVILTTNIIDALYFQQGMGQIMLANIGHYDWLDKLDFNILRGRNITIICDGTPSDKQYTIALIEKLSNHGLHANVQHNQQGALL